MTKSPGKPRRSGWTEERKARQREAIRRTKPWEKSTGPRTKAGKEKCAQNALKHGEYAAEEIAKSAPRAYNTPHVDRCRAL